MANMNVVDLTAGTSDGSPSPLSGMETPDQTVADCSQMRQIPSRLAPQAAAALQAGAKRKLPDSFQQQPARPNPVRQQVPTARSTALPAPPSALRKPAIKIRPPVQQQAAAHSAHNLSGGSSHAPAMAVYGATTAPAKGATSIAHPDALPVLGKPVSQASSAPRRMPESLSRQTTGSSTSGHSKGVGVRNLSAAASNKVGPSEHDTKVDIASSCTPKTQLH